MVVVWFLFVFKQKTAYEMRISDWSSDVALPISRFPWSGRAMPKTDTEDAGRRPHVRASTCSGAPLHRTVALHHCVASAGFGTLPATSPRDGAPMRCFLAVSLFPPSCDRQSAA